MFARVTTIQGNPEKIDDAVRVIENDVLPAAKLLPGFKNGYWCIDRTSGRMVSLTIFETEKYLTDSESATSQLRKTNTEKLGAEIKSVETFEVLAQA